MGGESRGNDCSGAGTDLQASAGSADSRRPIRSALSFVDDHALFRRGLEMVLAAEDDIELVGEASDGTEAVEKAGEALPDVVLMDIRMAQEQRHRGLPGDEGSRPQLEDRHADDQ